MKSTNYAFILIFAIIASACSSDLHKMVRKGNKKFDKGEYQFAISDYEEGLADGADTAVASFQIAESYRLSNRIREAIPFYEAALKTGRADEATKFHLANGYKTIGEYDKAKSLYQDYMDEGEDRGRKAAAKAYFESIDNIKEIKSKKTYYELSNLDVVNTPDAEYGTVFYNQEMVFTTDRNSQSIFPATGQGFTGIYKFKFDDETQKSGVALPLAEQFNTDKRHEASATFSKDGKTMVFARGNDGRKKGDQDVNLYISKNKKGEWSEPELLQISDPNAWDACPAFSPDGSTLYFASNREGGRGGIDLYMSKMDRRGNFRRVRNMGKTLNTPGDEMFPYVSDDRKLYFASNGHPGMGGLDVFEAVREGREVNVTNMGVPLNSSYDDFGLIFTSEIEGYITSNREGGKGDDDIYKFINNSPDFKVATYYVAGAIKDGATGEALAYSKVKLLDPRGEVVYEGTTDENGEFRNEVKTGVNYTVVAEKEDYLTANDIFSTIGKTVPQEDLPDFENDVDLKYTLGLIKKEVNKVIVLDNIYYDYNSSEIRDDAAEELDKLVTLLKDNMDMRIELSSHTDARGDDKYNQKLSQKRAESAVEYMANNGISEARMIPKGYGESRLIVENAESEEDHQKNRRTEFKILGFDVEQEVQPVQQENNGGSEDE